MALSDRRKWDAKYRGRSGSDRVQPPGWLLEHLDPLPVGRALDLATGHGHAAIELARRGWQVTAVDISPVGLQAAAAIAETLHARVQWIAADLDGFPLPQDHFDLITVFSYLDRERLPSRIESSLRPGGVLVYETFTLDQRTVPGNHLSNPAHMLEPGELLSMFRGLRVRHYRDVRLPDRAVASLVAEKPS